MGQAKVRYQLVTPNNPTKLKFSTTLPNGSDTWTESQILDYLPKKHQSSMYKDSKYTLLERK